MPSDELTRDVLRILDDANIKVIDIGELVEKPLNDVARGNQFIDVIVLADESGLTIAKFERFSDPDNFVDRLLAPASAVLVATSSKVASNSNIGAMNVVSVEGKNGGLMATTLGGEYILAIQYRRGAPKGLISRDLMHLKNMIEGVLKRNGII